MKKTKEFMEYIEFNNFEWKKKYTSILKYSQMLERIISDENVLTCFIGEAEKSKNLWDRFFDQTALYAVTNKNFYCVYPTYPGISYFYIPLDRIKNIDEKYEYKISSMSFKWGNSKRTIYLRSTPDAITKCIKSVYEAIDKYNQKEDDKVLDNTIPILSNDFMDESDITETKELDEIKQETSEEITEIDAAYDNFEPINSSDFDDFEEFEKLDTPISYTEHKYSNYEPKYDEDDEQDFGDDDFEYEENKTSNN